MFDLMNNGAVVATSGDGIHYDEVQQGWKVGNEIIIDPRRAFVVVDSTQGTDAILSELAAIDAASARPLRAIFTAMTNGTTPEEADVERLAELEAQADALRAELAALAQLAESES